MSSTKENDDTGEDTPVDASDRGLRTDNTEQENSPHSVETGAVQETPKPTGNGETLPDKTDIEMTAANEDSVEPQSTLDQSDEEPPPPSVPKTGDDEELVKLDADTTLNDGDQELMKPDDESPSDVKSEAHELPQNSDHGCEEDAEPNISTGDPENAEPVVDVKNESSQVPKGESRGAAGDTVTVSNNEPVTPHAGSSDIKAENRSGEQLENNVNGKEITTPTNNGKSNSKYMFLSDDSHTYEGNDSGTEEEQSDFMKEIENFFKERSMEFKPPKFYGEGLNCLK